jgi:hypothetical protein
MRILMIGKIFHPDNEGIKCYMLPKNRYLIIQFQKMHYCLLCYRQQHFTLTLSLFFRSS